jgi:hypothetical protein
MARRFVRKSNTTFITGHRPQVLRDIFIACGDVLGHLKCKWADDYGLGQTGMSDMIGGWALMF